MFKWLTSRVTSFVSVIREDVRYKSIQHWVNKKGEHYFRIEFDIRSIVREEGPDASDFSNKVLVVKWTGRNIVLVPDRDPRKER